MSLFFADLVREVSLGTGTGDLILEQALPGHRRFADVVPPGARFHYAIAGVSHPDQWETGEGEIGSGGMLLRTPLASSAGGGAVDFSPGVKTVALTVTAAWFTGQEEGAPVAVADVEGLQAALDAKAGLAGAAFSGAVSAPALILETPLAIADVDGLAAALDAKAGLAGAAFTGAVSAPALTLDTPLAIADVDGLAAALAGKAGLAGAAFTGDISAPHLALANDLAIADGGTGASSAAAARANLGLGSLATQGAGDVAISGGTVSGLASLAVAGDADVAGAYKVDGVQVAGNRIAGWGAPTGTASRAAFDTAGVTAGQLAQRLKALIDDLRAHGLIGS